MSRAAALYHMRERRRTADRIKKFAALIATPHDIGASAVTLPAAGTIAVSASVGVTAGDISIATNTSRTLATPNLSANQRHEIGFFEKGVTLDVTFSGGVVTLFIIDDWGKATAFAQGTFA